VPFQNGSRAEFFRGLKAPAPSAVPFGGHTIVILARNRAGVWRPPRQPVRRPALQVSCPTLGAKNKDAPKVGHLSSEVRIEFASQIVVEEELVGHGTEVNGSQLALALIGDPGLDQVGSEDVALQQELVIFLESVEHFG